MVVRSRPVLSAEQLHRPGTEIVEQVRCSVRYGESTLGSFYHGFHQLRSRDRQQWRILFELGTLTMTEWVPSSFELDVSMTTEALEALLEIIPGAEAHILEKYSTRDHSSRHRRRTVDVRARITTSPLGKMDIYG